MEIQEKEIAYPSPAAVKLPNGISLARGADDLYRIFRLRYDVYVQEYGRLGTQADHEKRVLRDVHDESAIHLFVEAGNDVIACVRMHLGGIPEELAIPLALEQFPEWRTSELGFVSKLMVHPAFRGSRITARLVKTIYHLARASETRAIFITTFPDLVALYERIGLRSYKDMYVDSELGPHYAMYGLTDDNRHFEAVGSVLRRETCRWAP